MHIMRHRKAQSDSQVATWVQQRNHRIASTDAANMASRALAHRRYEECVMLHRMARGAAAGGPAQAMFSVGG